jgi:hypothetical protein
LTQQNAWDDMNNHPTYQIYLNRMSFPTNFMDDGTNHLKKQRDCRNI